MPAYSTLRTLTLALAIAVPYAQATVVVPYVSYIDGPFGVPNEFVRAPAEESNGMTMFQGRIGVHLAIGTPPQHVWVAPHFYDSETYVKDVSICPANATAEKIEGPFGSCESVNSGLFATNESSTFSESDRMSFGTDTVTVSDATPDLPNDEFEFGIIATKRRKNYMGEDYGTFGLGPNSTFLQTFFPDTEQIGIYYTGGNSTHGKPAHSMPPRPLVIYELEFDGYNQSHFTGEKFTQPIGPPSPLSNTTNPFVLTVTGVKVGSTDILGGEPYVATVDLAGRTPNVFPPEIFESFREATSGRFNSGLLEYNITTLPTNPADWYNLTITFSNGFTVSVPQNILINDLSATQPDRGVANILSADDEIAMPIKGPIITLNTLMFASYIGIDHAAGEWWLAKAVHPWDEQPAKPADNNTSQPKEGAAAGGFGGNLKKEYRMGASAAALAAALLLVF